MGKENKSKQIMQSIERNESKQITKLYEYIVTVIKESHRVIKQSNQMKENKSKQITYPLNLNDQPHAHPFGIDNRTCANDKIQDIGYYFARFDDHWQMMTECTPPCVIEQERVSHSKLVYF